MKSFSNTIITNSKDFKSKNGLALTISPFTDITSATANPAG